jgi:CheY-like chemotaxis protein
MSQGASRSLSILLVDDHKDSLDLLARLLRRCGHTVETATRVDDAVRAVEQQRFDILVSDIGLPDGSGTEIMRALHAQQGAPGVALTGHGEEHYARACEDAGFAAHLLKPVVFDRLVKTMESILPAEVPKPIC